MLWFVVLFCLGCGIYLVVYGCYWVDCIVKLVNIGGVVWLLLWLFWYLVVGIVFDLFMILWLCCWLSLWFLFMFVFGLCIFVVGLLMLIGFYCWLLSCVIMVILLLDLLIWCNSSVLIGLKCCFGWLDFSGYLLCIGFYLKCCILMF